MPPARPPTSPTAPHGYEQIEINLGKACNNACVFCANGAVAKADRRLDSLELLQAEIRRAARIGYRALGLLGGEPTLHPHLAELICFARNEGFTRIAICTNGRRLRSRDRLLTLVDAGLTRIAFSIHHHRPEVADALSGRPGSHSQQVAAMRTITTALAEGRIALPHGLSANACLHGHNVRHAVHFARFLKKIGFRDIRFNALRPEHQAEGNRELVPGLTVLRRTVEQLVAWNEREGGLRLTFSDLPWCAFPAAMFWNPHLAERYLGDLHDAPTTVTAYTTEARERDHFDWKQRRTVELKAKLPACAECRLADSCEGLWKGYLAIHGAAGLRPIR